MDKEKNKKEKLGNDTSFTPRKKHPDEEFGNENIERQDLNKEYNSPNGERNRNYDSGMSINNIDRNDNLELSIDYEELVQSEGNDNKRNNNNNKRNNNNNNNRSNNNNRNKNNDNKSPKKN